MMQDFKFCIFDENIISPQCVNSASASSYVFVVSKNDGQAFDGFRPISAWIIFNALWQNVVSTAVARHSEECNFLKPFLQFFPTFLLDADSLVLFF